MEGTDMVYRSAVVAVISCNAYILLLYVLFGCNGFVAVQEPGKQVLFEYGLFRQEIHQEDGSTSCQAWTYESIFGVTDDAMPIPPHHMQLGGTTAILATISATLHLVLLASTIWWRIPNPIMRQLGGSLCMITLLLLAAMLPPAVSMPFCNRTSSQNQLIQCHVHQKLFYATSLLWIFACIGVTFVGDCNVDRILYRRRNEIEAQSESPKEVTTDMDDLEEGTSAPTLDDILMLCSEDHLENVDNVSPVRQDDGIPIESLAECVRSLQPPITETDGAEEVRINTDEDASPEQTSVNGAYA